MISYMWNLKNKINEYNKTDIDSQIYRKQTSGYQWEAEGREGQGSGRGLRGTN